MQTLFATSFTLTALATWSLLLILCVSNAHAISSGRTTFRKLLDTQLNSIDTHLAIGDVLAYDVTVGVGDTSKTDQATGAHTNSTTVAISQAAGLNNASCVLSACKQPTANSTGSTSTTTDKTGHEVLGGTSSGGASGSLKAATQSNVNSTSSTKTPSSKTTAVTNVDSGAATVKNSTGNIDVAVSSAASAATGSATSQQTGSTDSYGAASTSPDDNPASCAEVVQTATGTSDLSKTQVKDLVDKPAVLHCYLLLAAQKGR